MSTEQGVLSGRVALVTGAGSGIGRAAAELFAAQGSAVVVADVNETGEETVAKITAAGGRATFVQGDVSVEADVEAMVHTAESVLRRPRCRVQQCRHRGNAHGVRRARQRELGADDGRQRPWCVAVHEARAGRHGSAGARDDRQHILGGWLGRHAEDRVVHHGKARGHRATRTAAVEHARHGIRVNAIAPGMTRTAMVEDLFKDSGADMDAFAAAVRSAVLRSRARLRRRRCG